MLLGVALIGLEGVNLVFLRVSPKFITTYSMLPDPIPYSESESLSLRRRFRFLVSRFLRTFSSLSNLSLNWAKDCFVGMGFFPPFLVARKSDFSVPSFSKRRQSRVLCVVYEFSQPPESYVETCTSFYVFPGPKWLTGRVEYWTPARSHHRSTASHQ